MPFCKYCGKRVDGDERFCPDCGGNLQTQGTQDYSGKNTESSAGTSHYEVKNHQYDFNNTKNYERVENNPPRSEVHQTNSYQNDNYQRYDANKQNTYTASAGNPNDSGSFGWFLLAFILPFVGFILWLVWMDNKPKCSKMAGWGTLISILVGIGFYLIGVGMLVSILPK